MYDLRKSNLNYSKTVTVLMCHRMAWPIRKQCRIVKLHKMHEIFIEIWHWDASLVLVYDCKVRFTA